jgi:hypothetical protein
MRNDFKHDSLINILIKKDSLDSKIEVNNLSTLDCIYFLCQTLAIVINDLGDENSKTLGEKLDTLNTLNETMKKMVKGFNDVKLAGKECIKKVNIN